MRGGDKDEPGAPPQLRGVWGLGRGQEGTLGYLVGPWGTW